MRRPILQSCVIRDGLAIDESYKAGTEPGNNRIVPVASRRLAMFGVKGQRDVHSLRSGAD